MTAIFPELNASTRVTAGKAEARRLRREGKVPAIAYGKDFPATALSVTPKDVIAILKSETGRNSVVKVKIAGGKDILAMIREYTVHPLDRSLEHIDFIEVKLDREVAANVPLVFHGKAIGTTNGGVVRQVYRTVPVLCLPDRIPLKIETDISHLDLGEHIATQDLKLGEGVRITLPAEQTLIAIVAPEKDRSAEEDAAASAAGAAVGAAGGAPGAAAAAGAPAAAGAKPAAGAAAAAPAAAAKKK